MNASLKECYHEILAFKTSSRLLDVLFTVPVVPHKLMKGRKVKAWNTQRWPKYLFYEVAFF